MVTVNNLNFSYKKEAPVLKDISFTLEPGFTVLVGENGAGKSTLIKAITCSEYCDAEVLIDDIPLSRLDLKKAISYLPQEFDVYLSLKVRELLSFVAAAKGIPNRMIKKEILRAAQKVNITEYLDYKVKHCSIGTRHRVGIAAAMLGNAKLIVLDEPTAGLDPKERTRFYNSLKDCFSGSTVLISTHILDDMDILANHVIMLSSGKIVYNGKYTDFRHSIDGKVYCGAQLPASLPETAYVLSSERHGGKALYHIYSPVSLSSEQFELIEPSLEDIWEFYQKGGYHE